MERIRQEEINTAARRILGYLEAHGDAPVLAMKDDLGNSELQFYMGLGDLILRHQVGIREGRGTFWATEHPRSDRTL
ncbi:MAG TPA: hypothetical protein VLH58_12940 [Candidatus Methylomirabilis sp.]|nr:hypothetical protein [Candidatus Methylomirabilis sp.]HSC72256.1 hypothetical protein [Candidatus Methylomirabilis sp.]